MTDSTTPPSVPATAADPDDAILRIEGLQTWFHVDGQDHRAVDGVDITVPRGRVTAIVGESGCGKSVTAYSILRLINPPGRIIGGRILFRPDDGEAVDLAALDERDERLYDVRGGGIGMIFQEPMTALSPVHTIGDQLCEALLLHRDVDRKEAERRAVDMLTRVGLPAPASRLRQYPHQLSGGMRQRVVIAMALVCRPQLVIADEPTTALDVTIQAQILRLLGDLQESMGAAVLLITHDLGVVAQTADDVVVMYLGRVVEQGPVRRVLKHPRHPYTRGLLASLPGLHAAAGGERRQRLPAIPGSVPPLTDIPPGCPFHPRCYLAQKGLCDQGSRPPLEAVDEGGAAACLRLDQTAAPWSPRESQQERASPSGEGAP